ILEEIERMRTTLVGDDELSLAKDSFIETFPRAFESRDAMLGIFVDDEITGRAPDYWSTYRDRIRAVTAEDVRRVARAHLHPDRMAMLVVGRWAMIEAGDADGRASMKDLFGGRVEHLPLRDPLTLK
ncbi:MAG: insulinase family protein, partial [Phycisphaerales bacterium]|nr:insulinase family protein [Phycisphaerales bacterium]